MTSWGRAIGVRPGEARTFLLVGLLFAALEAGRGFGEVGADTLVVSRFGADTLPYLFIGLGCTSLVVALVYGAALGRLPRVPLIASLLLGAAGLLGAERLLIATQVRWAIPVTWLTVYAAGYLGFTLVWTVAGSVFDARQAKRLFPLCTASAIGGGFVGTLAAGPVARWLGTETLVLLEAGLLAGAGALVLAVSRVSTVRAPATGRRVSVVADLRAGFDEVRRSPLMRLVAAVYVLFAVLLFAVTYPFLLAASDAYPDEGDLATALGLLSAAVTGLSFLVSVGAANRVYRRFGITAAALLLPLVYVAGFGLWIVSFSFVTAAVVRITQQVTQRGISNAAWSAFYNVIPLDRRAQVLAFNDGVPGQLGTILSGVLLLAAGTLLTLTQVFWLGAATAVAATVLVLAIRRRYAGSLLRTLRSGLGERLLAGGPGLAALIADPIVVAALRETLAAPEAGVRLMATEMLAAAPGPAATTALGAAAGDADVAVRVAAVDALARRSDGTGHGLAFRVATARLADPAPEVRAAAVRLLVATAASGLDSRAAVESAAHDPSPLVRAAVAGTVDAPRAAELLRSLLAGATADERAAGLDALRRRQGPLPPHAIRPLLSDPEPAVRAVALRAVAACADDAAVLPAARAALTDEAPVVRSAAMSVLVGLPARARSGAGQPSSRASGTCTGRAALADWTHDRLSRALDLRLARAGVAPEPGPPAGADTPAAFLVHVLAFRERELVDDALAALAALGVPEADAAIRRSLGSADVEVRAQATEALESIGQRQLTGPLVRLLEHEPPASGDRAAVLQRLTRDTDPWIAALAAHVAGEAADDPGGARSSRRVTVDHASTSELPARTGQSRDRGGHSADVVGVGAHGVGARGGAVPETSRRLGALDTMLVLRRVPLFAGLGPEDLQRIAATASERAYGPGEVLMREGDVGDELVVLVHGSVRVVRAEPDGSERYIRSYAAGDHIGELAVLRAQPRAATVVAEAGGARGLVLAGQGLTAVLAERPAAAMAMLATLAERISRQ
jgi:CRP-like cAMP-binding protein/ATP/ADP translocase